MTTARNDVSEFEKWQRGSANRDADCGAAELAWLFTRMKAGKGEGFGAKDAEGDLKPQMFKEASGFTSIPQTNSLGGAVGVPLRRHAIALTRRERIHAGVVCVIHEVRDRIVAGPLRSRAGIATRGAAVSSRFLGCRIGHAVARFGAATLECVIQAEPVTDFVRARITQVVRGGGASRER